MDKEELIGYWNELKEQPSKMMTLAVASIVVAILLFTLIGFACSSSCNEEGITTESNYYYDEINTDYGVKQNPQEIYDKNSEKLLSVRQLPCPITYNDTKLNIAKTEYYQYVVDFSYNLLIIVTLDIGDMDDATIHWLTKSDLKPYAFITSEKNGYDTTAAQYIGCLQEEKALKYVFCSPFSMENRYSFEGSNTSISLRISQEKDDYTFVYIYSSDIPDMLPGTDAIEQQLKDYITICLYEIAEALKVG